METNQELACVYAALILQDDGINITADKIATLLKAADVDVEPFLPGLFARALEGIDLKTLITNVGSGVGSGPAAPAATGGAASASAAGDKKPEAKKEKEPEPESDDEEMGFGLFD